MDAMLAGTDLRGVIIQRDANAKWWSYLLESCCRPAAAAQVSRGALAEATNCPVGQQDNSGLLRAGCRCGRHGAIGMLVHAACSAMVARCPVRRTLGPQAPGCLGLGP